MRISILEAIPTVVLFAACVGESESRVPLPGQATVDSIIDMEHAALERWRQGDPDGFLEIIADDYTYFDPFVNERVDGRDAIREIYESVRGQVSFSRFDLIDPRVQVAGDIGVLTFNFKSYGPDSTGAEVERSHWHTTEVFRRLSGEWRLISTHWSFTQPQLSLLAADGQLTGETTDFPSLNRTPPSGGIPSLVVGIERAALDRWGAGDPGGYLDIIADEYTYFDPSLDTRIDDLSAMAEYLEPIRGQVSTSRYEMIDPYVQTDGVTAVLTFNLKTYGAETDGVEVLGGVWHSTEIYRQFDDDWKLISTHWSFTASWLREIAESL